MNLDRFRKLDRIEPSTLTPIVSLPGNDQGRREDRRPLRNRAKSFHADPPLNKRGYAYQVRSSAATQENSSSGDDSSSSVTGRARQLSDGLRSSFRELKRVFSGSNLVQRFLPTQFSADGDNAKQGQQHGNWLLVKTLWERLKWECKGGMKQSREDSSIKI